jgi:hypothetical protein
VSSPAICRGPVAQTTSCPSSSVYPRSARALRACSGCDGAGQRVTTGAVDPARAQGGDIVQGGLASVHGAILRRLTLDVRWPHTPSTVPPGRHRSRPGGTLCQEGPWRRSPPRAWLAARDVRRRPLVGRHQGPDGALAQNLHQGSPAATCHRRWRRPSCRTDAAATSFSRYAPGARDRPGRAGPILG